jgi:hypothetical protein
MSFRFNPFTGNLDYAMCDAEVARIACEKAVEVVRSIVTTDKNALGNKNFFYDPLACKYVEAGPQIVTDDDGVIVIDYEACEEDC